MEVPLHVKPCILQESDVAPKGAKTGSWRIKKHLHAKSEAISYINSYTVYLMGKTGDKKEQNVCTRVLGGDNEKRG